MKHILNNLSQEEKNSILEQHEGGMKVMTENFSKLLNSKLGDVKPINEQTTGGVPLKTGGAKVPQSGGTAGNQRINQLVSLLKGYSAAEIQKAQQIININNKQKSNTITTQPVAKPVPGQKANPAPTKATTYSGQYSVANGGSGL